MGIGNFLKKLTGQTTESAEENPLLKRMQQEAEERQLLPHPLLAKEMTESAKSAYLSGAVLAALLDDGRIDDAEKRAIRLLGLSLKMSESEITDALETVAALEGEDARFSFLQEILGEIGEHENALFFYCDIAKVFGAGGKFSKKAKAFLGAIGGMLQLSVQELQFLDLYVPFLLKGDQRDVRSKLTAFLQENIFFTFPNAVLKHYTPGMDVFSNSSVIFHAKGVDLELVKLEPGTFLMGSPDDELGRSSDENQHQVTLTKAFAIGKYPVTQAQYQAVMGSNPSSFKGNQRPVESVSWDDAMAFCRKLNGLTAHSRPSGYAFTLPTEAQWEYACRAGSTTALNNNSNLTTTDGQDPNLDGVAWYGKKSGTYDVGGKAPNAWGLYDMHGNVWEWCLDWYDGYPTHAVTDPAGAASGSCRVFRGGSWDVIAQFCRSAVRFSGTPDYRISPLGFRLVLASV